MRRMARSRATIFLLVAVFLAALAGVYAGRRWLPAAPVPESQLHRLLHDDLDLDARQRAALAGLETRFAGRRRTIEAAMRADNRALAQAIMTEHGAGPRVNAAIDRSHAAMGQLQKETLAHVFAMRRLLRADQAATFDAAVVKALTEDAR